MELLHPFKLTIKAVLSVPLPEFMLEMENCLRRETRLKTENSPDMMVSHLKFIHPFSCLKRRESQMENLS